MSMKARRDIAARHLPPWFLQGYGTEGHMHWNVNASSSSQLENKPHKRRSTAPLTNPLSPSLLSGSSSSILENAFYPALFRRKSSSLRIPQADADVFIKGANHDCALAGCERVTINVSGQRFETQLRTLNRFPQTLLGDPEKRGQFWDDERKEFFIDRHRPTFQAILYFYQSGGRLRKPLEVPEDVFIEELIFYQLGDEVIQAFKQKEGILGEVSDDDGTDLLPDGCWQKRVWLFCEEPDSSKGAKVFAVISILCIILSVTSFCLETLPAFRSNCINETLPTPTATTTSPTTIFDYIYLSSISSNVDSIKDNNSFRSFNDGSSSSSDGGGDGRSSNSSNDSLIKVSLAFPPTTTALTFDNLTLGKSKRSVQEQEADFLLLNQSPADKKPETLLRMVHNYSDPFYVIETICVIWFTFEFLLRFISSPSKKIFCRSIMNIFDLLAILPYFVVLGMQMYDNTCKNDEKSAGGAFVIVRILRVVRIFKLSKHSQGLRILGLTIKTSMRELGMFFFFLIVAMVIFSSAVYYAEVGEEKTNIDSIPGAFWWAVVTMTTVGYGDVTPVGVWGKLVGTLCVIAGVLTIALPVPVVVANFNNFYRHEI